MLRTGPYNPPGELEGPQAVDGSPPTSYESLASQNPAAGGTGGMYGSANENLSGDVERHHATADVIGNHSAPDLHRIQAGLQHLVPDGRSPNVVTTVGSAIENASARGQDGRVVDRTGGYFGPGIPPYAPAGRNVLHAGHPGTMAGVFNIPMQRQSFQGHHQNSFNGEVHQTGSPYNISEAGHQQGAAAPNVTTSLPMSSGGLAPSSLAGYSGLHGAAATGNETFGEATLSQLGHLSNSVPGNVEAGNGNDVEMSGTVSYITQTANASAPARTGRRAVKLPDGPPPPGMKWCNRRCEGWVPIELFGGRDTKACANCLAYDRHCYRSTQEKRLAREAAQQDATEGSTLPVAALNSVLVDDLSHLGGPDTGNIAGFLGSPIQQVIVAGFSGMPQDQQYRMWVSMLAAYRAGVVWCEREFMEAEGLLEVGYIGKS